MKQSWVDFRTVKNVVSMELALTHYGVMLHRLDRCYLRGRCPLPNHASKSSRQSFIVNTEKNGRVFRLPDCASGRFALCCRPDGMLPFPASGAASSRPLRRSCAVARRRQSRTYGRRRDCCAAMFQDLHPTYRDSRRRQPDQLGADQIRCLCTPGYF